MILMMVLFVEVVLSTDANEAFKDIDFAILLGGFPRKEGMERKDLIAKNVAIFKVQGTALNKVAKKTVKVFVGSWWREIERKVESVNCW